MEHWSDVAMKAKYTESFTSAWWALLDRDQTLPDKQAASLLERNYRVTPGGVTTAIYNYWWIRGGCRPGSVFLGPVPVGFRHRVRSWTRCSGESHPVPTCSEILLGLVGWTDTVLPDPPRPPLPDQALVWRSSWEEARRRTEERIFDRETWLWKWAVSDHMVDRETGCLIRRRTAWATPTARKSTSTGPSGTSRLGRGHLPSPTVSSLAV